MRIRLIGGGPWDGVEFDVPELPDEIRFRTLLLEFESDSKNPNVEHVRSDKREHHQYHLSGRSLKEGITLRVGENLPHEPEEGEDLLDLIDESLVIYSYRYAPGEKVWWDN
jgi:hypothetical protein